MLEVQNTGKQRMFIVTAIHQSTKRVLIAHNHIQEVYKFII